MCLYQPKQFWSYCTPLISVFSYPFQSYFINRIVCWNCVRNNFKAKHFALKQRACWYFSVIRMKTMVMLTHKVMSATNISEKNSIEKIPREFFPLLQIFQTCDLCCFIYDCLWLFMTVNHSLILDVALAHWPSDSQVNTARPRFEILPKRLNIPVFSSLFYGVIKNRLFFLDNPYWPVVTTGE